MSNRNPFLGDIVREAADRYESEIRAGMHPSPAPIGERDAAEDILAVAKRRLSVLVGEGNSLLPLISRVEAHFKRCKSVPPIVERDGLLEAAKDFVKAWSSCGWEFIRSDDFNMKMQALRRAITKVEKGRKSGL